MLMPGTEPVSQNAAPDTAVECRTVSSLSTITPEWQSLADNVVEDNQFYGPGSALSAARHLDAKRNAQALLVWRQGAASRILIGLFPFVFGAMGRHLTGWMTPYFVSAAPLLRQGFEQPALAGLLQWAARRRPRPASLLLPQIDLDGAVVRELQDAARHQLLPLQVIAEHDRAQLDLSPKGRVKQRTYISANRRKGLDRRWRKLSELGELHHVVLTSPEDVRRGVLEFLKLEQAGWKGRQGSALASKPATENFALQAYTAHAGTDRTRCELLVLDERPVAASITLLSGSTGWAIKSAYDETLARFAPGLLNDYASLKALLADPVVERIDSAAKPGHVLESLWAGRRRTGDILLGLQPGMPDRGVTVRAGLLGARELVRTRLRRLQKAVKSRGTPSR